MTTEEAIRLYQEGGTITDLCSRAGMTYFSFRRRLIAAGITPRKVGRGPAKSTARKDTPTNESDKWAQSLANDFLSKPLLRTDA